MIRYAAIGFAVVVLASIAHGQDEVKKDFPADYVQNVLIKQGMAIKADIKPDTDAQKKVSIYGTPDGEFDLHHHFGDKKFVFMYVYNPSLKINAAKANAWNNLNMHTRAYVDGGGRAVLAGVLPYDGGLSLGQFVTFHLHLKGEMQAFEAFAKKK